MAGELVARRQSCGDGNGPDAVGAGGKDLLVPASLGALTALVIVVLLGLLSAVVDNVPLVAASIGMYDVAKYPVDSFLWEFIAYCAGTGGSILIIGSAAGIAAMGLERITFLWYFRKVSWLALLGYVAGAAVYVVQYRMMQ